ncbi:F0F1 ATP synthase subunit B [Poriferisphaera sp. WC338]|uniref:F0F1 ATP synthase subunit B n=1 Tax=Poriferisphaera sp. WC338 TaxID=3425129 RepID=UPI003D81AD30
MKKITFYAALMTMVFWFGGFARQATTVDQYSFDLSPATAFAAAPAGDEAVDAHAAQIEEDKSLLSFDPGILVWELVLFLVLFAVLAKFVWPPILKGLQDREQKIEGDLANAEKASNDATSKLDELKAQLADANKQAQEIIDASRVEAQKLAEQIKSQAEADTQTRLERVESEIRGAKEAALAEIYEQTAALSTSVAGKILQKEISADDQRSLIDQSLAAFKDRN